MRAPDHTALAAADAANPSSDPMQMPLNSGAELGSKLFTYPALRVLHLTASRFFGGPENQMLGLAEHMRDWCPMEFASYSEGGLCRDFLERVRAAGFHGVELTNDTPRLWAAYRELVALVRERQYRVILCNGYKAGILGLMAARTCKITAIGVSRGWTGESRRVRLYERADRMALRRMDRVVCVSHGQAAKVRKAGVSADKISVVWDSVVCRRFNSSADEARQELSAMFRNPPQTIVGAAGRLSPEKGYVHLVDAAAIVLKQTPSTGFVLFGSGALRDSLERRIREHGIEDRFVLGGFRRDLDRFFPAFDLFVLPSYTEGLPNVVLESLAARVPVVATAVGGTPEAIEDGACGFLVPPGECQPLAERIVQLLNDADLRTQMGDCGHDRVHRVFTFESQVQQYCDLLRDFVPQPS